MEEDISPKIYQPVNKLAEERLEKAIKEAEEILEFEAAHDPELLQALDIVKQYIRKKKLICYGGTAMNALLPKKDKFYDLNYDLPDYDFFTYDVENDVKDLVTSLKAAGFKNIYKKMGIHEGTNKILVNYVAIADITQLHKDDFDILFKNSKKVDGVYYANENVLRMMMFLELSRPRGEVERWKKVYERLQLMNKYFPTIPCKKKHHKKQIPEDIRKVLYEYIFDNQRVIANIELEALYNKSLTSANVKFNTEIEGSTIIIYSPDLKKDVRSLKSLLPEVSIVYYPQKGDFLANRISLVYEGIPVILLIEETGCHSYNNVKTQKGHTIHIASLETLITLHYSLYFFSKTEKTYLCAIGKCIKTFLALAISPITMFDAFPVNCSGYQKGFPTLLREKLERSKKTPKKSSRTTRKNSTLKKNG